MHIRGSGSLGHYLHARYALVPALTVFFPHVVATIVTRTCTPGLLTGLLFVLPSATALLLRSFVWQQLEVGRFLVVSVIGAVVLGWSLTASAAS